MNNKVFLLLDKPLSGLVGYSSGKVIYEKQVKGSLDPYSEMYIQFPDNIVKVSSSFIQGFFEELIELIGIVGIKQRVHIISSHPYLSEIIMDNLY